MCQLRLELNFPANPSLGALPSSKISWQSELCAVTGSDFSSGFRRCLGTRSNLNKIL